MWQRGTNLRQILGGKEPVDQNDMQRTEKRKNAVKRKKGQVIVPSELPATQNPATNDQTKRKRLE